MTPKLSTQLPVATDELKFHTKDLHRRIEGKVNISERILTQDSYGDLLGRMWGFYAGMEEALGRLDWQEVGLDFNSRRKTELLEADILGLGKSLSQQIFGGPFPFTDLAGGFGSLYVLEGATLGGQFILKMLSHRGRWAIDNSRFYTGYGELTGTMWNEFKTAANRYCSTPASISQAKDSAAKTFEQFGAWVAPSP